MTLIQLNLPLPLETSNGAGWTHFLIDYEPGIRTALGWCLWTSTALLDETKSRGAHDEQLDHGDATRLRIEKANPFC